MWRKTCVGVAPSTRAASSMSAGTACSRARMNRKANGNDFQDSKKITMSSAVGTPMLSPNSVISPSSWLRNGIGESQPSTSVPTALTKPSCGESSTRQMNAIATTGATYGSSITPRTSPRPGNGAPHEQRGGEPEHDRPERPEDRVHAASTRIGRQEVRRAEQQVVVAQRVLAAEHVEPADLEQPDALEREQQRPQHRQHHHHEHDDHGRGDERHAGARVAPRAGAPRAARAAWR